VSAESPQSGHLPLAGKQILLGVSGSIAAYRAADICSQLGKLGASVTVCLTESAAKFIGEATFRALSRNPVLTDLFVEPHHERIAHIDAAQSADLVLVAPASANILARMAAGIADDMLSTCLLAVPAQTAVLVAPAMNTHMWNHAATRANVATLQSRGIGFIAPEAGLLACQDVGMGRLAAVETIVTSVVEALARKQRRDLNGKRIVITAGATREPIDPVRFITNRSSGKMGVALAAAAADRGADVVLVAGAMTAPIPIGIKTVKAETAREMHLACLEAFRSADIFIGAAAVADFAVSEISQSKIKKQAGEALTLQLVPNPDIIAEIGASKTPGQAVIGFAAETADLLPNAIQKMQRKHLDLIAANDVSIEGAGFDTDTNILVLIRRDGSQKSLPIMSKRAAADQILDEALAILAESGR
jgi:phosphopantothenoylcysteine decarboxylase / phosphopantothenate---cysteine ligase